MHAEDIESIQQGQWLRSGAIDSFIKAANKILEGTSSYIWDTGIITFAQDQNISTMHRWKRKYPNKSTKHLKYIYFPANHFNMHWILYVVDIQNKIIHRRDSDNYLTRNEDREILNIVTSKFHTKDDPRFRGNGP